MVWIDAIILVYLLYSIISGWRGGFAARFFRIAAGLLSIIGAVVLCKPVTAIVDESTGAGAALSLRLQEWLATSFPAVARFDDVIKAMRFPSLMGISLDVSAGLKPAADLMARSFISSACFIALLIVIRIVVEALGRVIAFPFEHGPAAIINRAAGAVFGGALGFAYVAILWVVLMPMVAIGWVRPSTVQSSTMLNLAGALVARIAPWVMGMPRAGGL